MYERALTRRGVAVRWITMTHLLQAISFQDGSTLAPEFERHVFGPELDGRLTLDRRVLGGASVAFLVSNRYPHYSTLANALLTDAGVVMPNSPLSVHQANDKWLTFKVLRAAGLPVAHSFLAHDRSEMSTVAEVLGFPVVVKQLDGARGTSVRLAQTVDEACAVFDELYVDGQPVVVQHYIECGATDKRIIVIDGQFVAAMTRHAGPGEFRSNIALGGEARSCETTPMERELAVAVAEALGLRFAGLDIATVTKVLEGREYLPDAQPFCLEANAMPALDLPLEMSGVDGSQTLVDLLLGSVKANSSV